MRIPELQQLDYKQVEINLLILFKVLECVFVNRVCLIVLMNLVPSLVKIVICFVLAVTDI